MIEKIFENLYRIEIPLRGNPLRSLNSYVIRNGEKTLVVDTGWDQEESLRTMKNGLAELDVDLAKTDFFITHFHADHLGLVPKLAGHTSKVYLNEPDAEWFNSRIRWEDLAEFARANGFPDAELLEIQDRHPGFRYRAKEPLSFHLVREGDELRLGDYRFRCISTPGHSKGHMCLYEAGKKVLISGDHILNDISPTIQLWSDDWNPLAEYLGSLENIYDFNVDLVLPGHRSLFQNFRGRIEELKKHHRDRLDEILDILEEVSEDVYRIASRMTWDIVCDSWESFPVTQKWFAFGEASAHLKYLEEKGLIRRETRGGRRVFSLVQKKKADGLGA